MHYAMAVFRCGHTSKTFQRYVFVSIGFSLDTEEISFGQTEIAELTQDEFQLVKPEIAKRKIFVLESRVKPLLTILNEIQKQKKKPLAK